MTSYNLIDAAYGDFGKVFLNWMRKYSQSIKYSTKQLSTQVGPSFCQTMVSSGLFCGTAKLYLYEMLPFRMNCHLLSEKLNCLIRQT